jgi:hypothetical protein
MVLAKRLRARGAFANAPSNQRLEQIIPADAMNFHDAMVRALPLPFHLTCFSKHVSEQNDANGLLTLWRFYGGEGKGIALGFNTRKLVEASFQVQKSHSVAAIYLDEVRYGADDQILQSRLADAPGLVEMFLEFMENLITGRKLEFGTRQLEMFQFTVLAACAKHPDFVDEREIRLVTTPAFKGYEHGRQSAVTADARFMLLPYLQALERIVVGPSTDQVGLEAIVRAALARTGFAHVRVDRSKTPFRFVHR